MGLFDRFKKRDKSLEGSWRGPFMGVGELGGLHQFDPLGDGWQRNIQRPEDAEKVPTIYACVMAIARSISQCYPKHVRRDARKFESITNSAAFRTLKNPNEYQSSPEFLLNMVAAALFKGESFAIAVRNDRNEIVALHPLGGKTCTPFIDPDTKAIFYQVGQSELIDDIDYLVPARDIWHLKFHTPRHPLVGESPIKAAALAVGINVALNRNQAAFFAQMNRPSGVLRTDEKLRPEQIRQLREAFDQQSKAWSQGGLPILTAGLQFQQLGVSSQDAQVVQAQRMSSEEICKVFGVPPPLIGDLSHSTLSNAETMISNFLSLGLGSYLEMIERSLDRLFGLKNNEFVELDTAALLRTDFEGRINGLTKAVQGGLFTPDEARAREGLSPIKGGDAAFLQRQMVPINLINDLLERENQQAAEPEPMPEAEPVPTAESEEQKTFDSEVAQLFIKDMIRERMTQ